jgi:hypothetical protein
MYLRGYQDCVEHPDVFAALSTRKGGPVCTLTRGAAAAAASTPAELVAAAEVKSKEATRIRTNSAAPSLLPLGLGDGLGDKAKLLLLLSTCLLGATLA